jgi:hypothetical protein
MRHLVINQHKEERLGSDIFQVPVNGEFSHVASSFPGSYAVASHWASHNSIQAKFEQFHEQNPKVYAKLVEYAFLAKANGHKHISIKLLFERLRWYATVEIKSDDTYVLNNSYTSRYARLIMQQEPALKDFFVTREVRS